MVAVAATPSCRQRFKTVFSFSGRSTLNASAATTALHPFSFNAAMAFAASSQKCSVSLSTYSFSEQSCFVAVNGISPMAVSLFDFAPSIPFPIVTIPTFTTSPSSSALVAWVVPWEINATSSGLTLFFSIMDFSTCTMPAATPALSSWVVGVFTVLISSNVSLLINAASVNVPPTSIPILTFIPSYPFRPYI